MYNGVINVYKEMGFTSHDVVAKLRGILHMKKIGHTGTLDPDAVGVLPICLGNATKLCDMLTDRTKTYRTVMQLGTVTDTQDMSGSVIRRHKGGYPDNDKIISAVNSFKGEYNQIPPMYSALKVDGKKLYELARQGIEIERKARAVCINSISIDGIDDENHTVTMLVDCSKGTYIRTLCHDIGVMLGTGACMKSLVRTRVADFRIDGALKLEDISRLETEGRLERYITSVEEMFKELGAIVTDRASDVLIFNGNKIMVDNIRYMDTDNNQLDKNCIENGIMVRAYDSGGVFRAVYQYEAQGHSFRAYKMFSVNQV